MNFVPARAVLFGSIPEVSTIVSNGRSALRFEAKGADGLGRQFYGFLGVRAGMALKVLFQGIAIGLSIAAPVGPIGVLCIRRSLADGTRIGFAVGLGAATADAAYGCVAGFGLTVVSRFLVDQRFWLGLGQVVVRSR